jgi:hypothetical protein
MNFCSNLNSLEKDNKGKKTINGGQEGIFRNYTTLVNTIGEGIKTKEEFGSSWYQEKTRGL